MSGVIAPTSTYQFKYSRLKQSVDALQKLPPPASPIVPSLRRQLEQTCDIFNKLKEIGALLKTHPSAEALTAALVDHQALSGMVSEFQVDFERLKSYRDTVIQPHRKQLTLFAPSAAPALPPANEALQFLSDILSHSQQVAARLLMVLTPQATPKVKAAPQTVELPGPFNKRKNTNSAQKMRRAFLEGRPIRQNGMILMPNNMVLPAEKEKPES